MNKRTRLFLGIAAGILIIGLGTGLVAAYLGGFQNLLVLGSNGPEELAYLPSDTRLVAFANVREIMDSDFRRKLKDLPGAQHRTPPEWGTQTGLDIERDIDSVVASSSIIGGDVERQQPLMLARGRFDQTRIEAFIREHGGTVQDHKGTRLLEFTNPNQQNGSVTVAFVEPGLVAVGSPVSVRRAIDTKAAGQGDVTDNADLMRMLKDVDAGNTWVVGRFDSIAGSDQLPAAVKARLPAISWLSAEGHVNGGVRGTLRAETRDDAAAQDLRQVIQGFMALVRMQAGQRPEFSGVLNSLEVGGSGKTVSLGFSVPTELIDGLAALAAQGRRGGPPREVTPPATP